MPIDTDQLQLDIAIQNLNSTINQPKTGLNLATIQTPIDADRLQSDIAIQNLNSTINQPKIDLNSASFGINSELNNHKSA